MSDDTQKPPEGSQFLMSWDFTCGKDANGITGMVLIVAPLPDDVELLKEMAVRMREAGRAFLAERGHPIGDVLVDTSPPDSGQTLQ